MAANNPEGAFTKFFWIIVSGVVAAIAAVIIPPLISTPPPSPPSGNNSALSFYRRLDNDLTQLNYSVGVLAAGKFDPNDRYRKVQITNLQSDLKSVCEARPKVATLGDKEILEQLDGLCLWLGRTADMVNEATGGLGTQAIATALVQQGLLQQLRNNVASKSR